MEEFTNQNNQNNDQQKKPTDEELRNSMWEEEEKLTLEERRKRYKCGKRFVLLEELDTYEKTLEDLKITCAEEVFNLNKRQLREIGIFEIPKFKPNLDINKKICTWQGDITLLEIDGILNAANTRLLGGGGIDGCIHRAAGNKLYKECLTLHGANTGETKITRGYKLPSKFVLHTVGPIGEKPELLRSCYRTTLDLCVKHGVRTIALCGVSTGIFGYPLYNASNIACETVRQWLEEGNNKDNIDKIIFCTFLLKEKICYEKLLPFYFPPPFKNEPKEENKETTLETNNNQPKEENKETTSQTNENQINVGNTTTSQDQPKEENKETTPQTNDNQTNEENKETIPQTNENQINVGNTTISQDQPKEENRETTPQTNDNQPNEENKGTLPQTNENQKTENTTSKDQPTNDNQDNTSITNEKNNEAMDTTEN